MSVVATWGPRALTPHGKWTAVPHFQPSGNADPLWPGDCSRKVGHPELERMVFLNFRYWPLFETFTHVLQAKSIIYLRARISDRSVSEDT